jgi:hypothetical protein
MNTINHRSTNAVLFAAPREGMSDREVVEIAVQANADLVGANFANANLTGARFECVNLTGADFYGADLTRADLTRANLRSANLTGARFEYAKLVSVNFKGADFTNTILDPNRPLRILSVEELTSAGLELDGEFVLGWRSKKSIHCGNTAYEVGKEYSASWFSSDETSACHPGIYFASKEWLKTNYPEEKKLVRVRARRDEVVHAGDKFRAKRIWVLE